MDTAYRTKIVKRDTYASAVNEAWKTGVTPHYNRICDNIDRVGGSGYCAKWSNPNACDAQD